MFIFTTQLEFWASMLIATVLMSTFIWFQTSAFFDGKILKGLLLTFCSVVVIPTMWYFANVAYTESRKYEYKASFICLAKNGHDIIEFAKLSSYEDWKEYAEEKNCFPKE